ncbi:uncharacterized protein N7482_001112 [Penicillium canariense]|uniref:Complex 1 LYR protein domain-containing protein n=1 Tax=Penicillium canariense TaxID=189055 RepID=A0A9W9LT99_9EURO|nr:uncharacterized protein N7482_001112 [Penicillium canariense]KAJ5175235.1 hypothetical protein N7482_001112 [Penicillium canariense]
MRQSLSLLAAVSRNQPSKLKKPAISLDHFIQRQRVLAFWREIVRALHKIPPSSTRDELRSYARREFERHREVSDLVGLPSSRQSCLVNEIANLGLGSLTYATCYRWKAEFETMRRYLDEQIAG